MEASQVGIVVWNPPVNAGDRRDADSTPGSKRVSGGGHGNPLQCSCLENPMDRGAWQATAHRVTKSQTRLKRISMHAWVFGKKTIEINCLFITSYRECVTYHCWSWLLSSFSSVKLLHLPFPKLHSLESSHCVQPTLNELVGGTGYTRPWAWCSYISYLGYFCMGDLGLLFLNS